MKENLKKNFFAAGIGSVPYKNAKEAVEKILKNFSEIPFWPQLPKRSFFENMYVQYIEGFPGVVVDSTKKTVWVDTSKDLMKKIEEAYQKVLDNDLEYFSIRKDHAEGFYELLDELHNCPSEKPKFAKGQVTGPVSLGLSVTDEKKRAILYHAELSELLTKVLSLKIKWQIRKIREIIDSVIIFIDEPYLVSIGSSYVNIKSDEVISKIKELIGVIHEEGALAGIHCCGNTDWSLLLRSGIDILNFDAYNFMNSVSLYPQELKNFLDKDGFIAWGIVPTSKAVNSEDSNSLIKRLEEGMELLVDKKISRDKLLGSTLVTPSCGCGTMDAEDADRVLSLTREVSNSLKKKYG